RVRGTRGVSKLSPVVTFEGVITGLKGQAGMYALGGGPQGEMKLFLQHFPCSLLGAGLRAGARVRLHNVHPVYMCGRLEGFGACLRSYIQVLEFSPRSSSSYRPLLGGPSHQTLVAHAWGYTFKRVFDERLPKEWCRGRGRGQASRGQLLEDAAQWVLQAAGVQAQLLLKRDVYAEFLAHGPGVCGIVCPQASGEKKARGGSSGACWAEAPTDASALPKGYQWANESWHGDVRHPNPDRLLGQTLGARAGSVGRDQDGDKEEAQLPALPPLAQAIRLARGNALSAAASLWAGPVAGNPLTVACVRTVFGCGWHLDEEGGGCTSRPLCPSPESQWGGPHMASEAYLLGRLDVSPCPGREKRTGVCGGG
ncbi:unnamed protein product, partial [Discosporangium mesarthrocarpum]